MSDERHTIVIDAETLARARPRHAGRHAGDKPPAAGGGFGAFVRRVRPWLGPVGERLGPVASRLGPIRLAGIAAAALVAVGFGFVIFSPSPGAAGTEALPPSSASPVAPGASRTAAPSSTGPSTLASLPAGGAPVATGTRLPGSRPGSLEDDAVPLVNQARAQAGCQAVRVDGHLRSAAGSHSDDMARHGYVGSAGSDGTGAAQRVRKAGYRGTLVGEDVTRGYPTAQGAVSAWLGNPGYRGTLLNCSATVIGVGVAFAKDGTVYWTADLGA